MTRFLDDPRTRVPLMALGMLALAAGLYGGLQRIGWWGNGPQLGFAALHGPLMVCAFLGTLISTERAVALGRLWAYLAPITAGAGGLLLISGAGGRAGPALLAISSLILIGIFVRVLRMQFQPFAVVMTIGAASWAVGNILWLSGRPIFDVVAWWLGFLVLTIAGERLELSRMLMHAARVQQVFLGMVAVLVTGLFTASFAPDAGVRLTGFALILLSAWLLRYDVARHTVRQSGLTRFIAWCLLAGYVWLITGGVLMLTYGFVLAGPHYDAMLHAVFVGFVFSMIFGHAPVIFPSVLGVPLAYSPAFYAHLILLHGSLALRLTGDVAGIPELRRFGGMLNAVAIVLFLAATVTAVVREVRMRRSDSAFG